MAPWFVLPERPGWPTLGTEGDDTFVASLSAWLAVGRDLFGRGGLDTLRLSVTGDLDDASFENAAGLEALVLLPGSDSVPTLRLGSFASACFADGLTVNGILILDASAMTVPIIWQAEGGFIGGSANDVIRFDTIAQLRNSFPVNGGAGFDVLALGGDGITLVASNLTGVSSIEALQLQGNGSLAIEWGAAADIAFASTATILADAAESLWLDASVASIGISVAGTGGSDILRTGAGNDALLGRGGADAISAGGGIDHVVFDTAQDLRAIFRATGDSGADILLLRGDNAHYSASDFDGNTLLMRPTDAFPAIYGFEEVRLAGRGDLSVELADFGPFVGSERAYGSITAPEAASLTADLSKATIGLAVYGSQGADSITAGRGHDWLVGGAGGDRFTINNGCAIDVIADFVSGSDRIALSGFVGRDDFAALQAHMNVVDGNLVIGLSSSDAIILAGVHSVAAGDFLFG